MEGLGIRAQASLRQRLCRLGVDLAIVLLAVALVDLDDRLEALLYGRVQLLEPRQERLGLVGLGNPGAAQREGPRARHQHREVAVDGLPVGVEALAVLHQLRCGDERRVAHLRSDGILVVVERHLPADPGEIGEDRGRGRVEVEDAGERRLLGTGDPLPVARMGVEEPGDGWVAPALGDESTRSREGVAPVPGTRSQRCAPGGQGGGTSDDRPAKSDVSDHEGGCSLLRQRSGLPAHLVEEQAWAARRLERLDAKGSCVRASGPPRKGHDIPMFVDGARPPPTEWEDSRGLLRSFGPRRREPRPEEREGGLR